MKDEGDPAEVTVTGSEGIVIGSGNSQYNNWIPKPPLDPVALGALNPHTAVARLQALTHEELVDFFARAKPEDVSEILTVFYEFDRDAVVAVLGDIKRLKAAELIDAVCGDALTDLPEAAHEIARKAALLGWTDAGPLIALPGITKLQYVQGYKNETKRTHVFWSDTCGVSVTVGALDDYWTAAPHALGVANGDQEIAPTLSYGTGLRQRFDRGVVYSSKHGTFQTGLHSLIGNPGSDWLGFPVGEVGDNPGFMEVQPFEGGAIYSYAGTAQADGTVPVLESAVRGMVVDALSCHGAFCPVSDEISVVSFYGAQEIVQRFEFRDGQETYESAVYWHEGHAAIVVAREVWPYYCNLEAEKSWLGFPASQADPFSHPVDSGAQHFEEGLIYWQPGFDPVAVPNATLELIENDDVRGRVGMPVSEEKAVGDGDERIQYFENGVVTFRGGRREAWLRPGSSQRSSQDPDETTATGETAAQELSNNKEPPTEAIIVYRRALAERERIQGQWHPDVTAMRQQLAEAYLADGCPKAAIQQYEKVVAGRERELGPDHLLTVAARGALGAACHAGGKMASAVRLGEETRTAYARLQGVDHPDTLAASLNLAHAYLSVGRNGDAGTVLEDTVERCNATLAPDDPLRIAAQTSWRNIGRVLKRPGCHAFYDQPGSSSDSRPRAVLWLKISA